jgi:hypothetical protein
MTRNHRRAFGFVLVLGMLAAGAAQAQTQPPIDWQRSSSLFLTAGASSGAAETGATFGGAVAWDLTSRFTIDGSGTWLGRGPGIDGFAAQLGGAFNLLPAGAYRVTPYVAGSFGFYRATFDLAHPGLRAAEGAGHCQAGQAAAGAAVGPCLQQGMPTFYARRLPAGGGLLETRSFTDPAFTAAGGLTLALTQHVLLRPEAGILVVTADGESHRIGMFSVNIGYRFRALPIQR